MAKVRESANNLYSKLEPAVILLSGGIDSLLVAMLAQSDNTPPHQRYSLTALVVNYGQPRDELLAAHQIAYKLDIHIEERRCQLFPSADPSGTNYIPGRNTVLLSIAANMLPNGGGIFFGANEDDYADYPDCRMEFLTAFEAMQAAQGRRIWIRKPLINLPKIEVIRQAIKRGAPLELTSTCYQPNLGRACGVCNSCRLRRKAFADLGQADPALYAV